MNVHMYLYTLYMRSENKTIIPCISMCSYSHVFMHTAL